MPFPGATGRSLLYFAPSISGGIADYSREQADALAGLGVQVCFLTAPEFKARPQDRYRLQPLLPSRLSPASSHSRLRTRFTTARRILADMRVLSKYLEGSQFRHVLFGTYMEYLAPVWAGHLRRLAARGLVFGAVIHDPVRDAVIGPLWWHRRSIAAGYSFLREAFVHEPVELDTARPQPRLRITVIPHGPFATLPPGQTRVEARQSLDLPPEAKVLLAFGHVRDNKNLDLALHALKQFPELILIVAGKPLAAAQRPVSFYQSLAEELGVASRCRWLNSFIPEAEVGNLFAASDVVLLTYSRQFRSASGVLNLAVAYRKPCLASSGQGNLQTVVSRYRLGLWVEPDSAGALAAGIQKIFREPPAPDWDRYAAENSWETNAETVVARIFEDLP